MLNIDRLQEIDIESLFKDNGRRLRTGVFCQRCGRAKEEEATREAAVYKGSASVVFSTNFFLPDIPPQKMSFQINLPKNTAKIFRPSGGINFLPVLNPNCPKIRKSPYKSFLTEKFPGKLYFITSEKKTISARTW